MDTAVDTARNPATKTAGKTAVKTAANTADFLLAAAEDGAVAVEEPGAVHTYADLHAAAAMLADRLAQLGLPAGAPVAVAAPNGFFWVAAYLATLSQGYVVVPLPVTLPAEEMAGRMRWVGVRAAFLGRRQECDLAGRLPAGVPALGEDVLDGAATLGRPRLRSRAVAPDADAVYAFTSGTTGRPRVVRTTHRNLQANTRSILGFLDLASDDRVLVVLPFTYVFGASVLNTHLRVGAALVVEPSFVYAETIVERLAQQRCTGFAGVPSTFHLLLRSSTFASRPLPALRTIQQAGGHLATPVLRELVAAQPQARVFVMYGQTEATARLSYLPPEEVLSRAGSIGRGIPGVELSVVGPSGAPVRPGEVGEIRASGASISPGYLRDPEATARKMPGGVLHTGDLATVDEDGYVYVVDRSEDFIKSWGHRIAGKDVEAVVMELDDVVSASVVGVPDEAAGERVELVVVARPGAVLDRTAVLRHCRRRLAKHMVPAVVHVVDRLPLSANGKVLKTEVRRLCQQLSDASPQPI